MNGCSRHRPNQIQDRARIVGNQSFISIGGVNIVQVLQLVQARLSQTLFHVAADAQIRNVERCDPSRCFRYGLQPDV